MHTLILDLRFVIIMYLLPTLTLDDMFCCEIEDKSPHQIDQFFFSTVDLDSGLCNDRGLSYHSSLFSLPPFLHNRLGQKKYILLVVPFDHVAK